MIFGCDSRVISVEVERFWQTSSRACRVEHGLLTRGRYNGVLCRKHYFDYL